MDVTGNNEIEILKKLLSALHGGQGLSRDIFIQRMSVFFPDTDKEVLLNVWRCRMSPPPVIYHILFLWHLSGCRMDGEIDQRWLDFVSGGSVVEDEDEAPGGGSEMPVVTSASGRVSGPSGVADSKAFLRKDGGSAKVVDRGGVNGEVLEVSEGVPGDNMNQAVGNRQIIPGRGSIEEVGE